MCRARIRDGQPGRNCERKLALYDGQDLLGHIVSRGKGIFEAFDPMGKAIGICASQAAAMTALERRR
jgi:hypothetical protein